MYKIPRQRYTTEFKREAVRQVESGKSPSQVARELGIAEQTLSNWRKAAQSGKLASEKTITPQEMELSRLRAELAKAKMENEILKKAAAYFARESL